MRNALLASGFIAHARERGWLDGLELTLVDVGASGGLDPLWRQFEPGLRAIGFDPLETEVDRLNQLEENPDVSYETCWVDDGLQEEPDTNTESYFALTSAYRAMQAIDHDYVKEAFNSGEEVRLTNRHIGIDAWLAESGFGDVDVLKTDTDGGDFGVLNSARRLLSEGTVLAVVAECQFHEPIGKRAPVFSEIDSLLRDAGYRLFDMDVWSYTRGALPGEFMHDIYAQTNKGQAQFCDALYMLDPVADARAYQRLVSLPDTKKLAKLVFLCEIFGLPDCAAALLNKLRNDGVTAGEIDIEEALNRLVPMNPWKARDYKTFLSEFDRDPGALFPSRVLAANEVEDRKLSVQVKRALWRMKKRILGQS